MKILFFILFPFLISNQAICQKSKFFIPKDQLPTEFKILVDTYQRWSFKFQDGKDVTFFMEQIDYSLTGLSKEEVYFICKSEIYKELLVNYPKDLDDIKIKSFKVLKKKLDEILKRKKTYDLFSQWIIASLKKDFRNFVKIRNKKFGQRAKKDFKKLIFWIHKIYNSTPEGLTLDLISPIESIFFNIIDQIRLLFKYSRFQGKKYNKEAPLNFFTLVDHKNLPVLNSLGKPQTSVIKSSKKSRVIELLAPITDDDLKVPSLPQPTDDWTPKN